MESCAELCGDSTPHRTIWTIVRTCLATIFACAWVAVHPNIPNPNYQCKKILLTRFGIMFMMLIAPEMVITWATRQYIAAWEIQKQLGDPNEPRWYNNVAEYIKEKFGKKVRKRDEHRWTIVHSFFLVMGGFVLFDRRRIYSRDNGVIDMQIMRELKDKKNINWPPVSEADLLDKTKGDFFSKGVVIFQVTWFIIQCIVRAQQKSTLTQLEIATLAYAPLTLALYMLWWDKPLGVKRAVIVTPFETQSIDTSQSRQEPKLDTTRDEKEINEARKDSMFVLSWISKLAWKHIGCCQKMTIIFLFLIFLPFVVVGFVFGVVQLVVRHVMTMSIWPIIRPIVTMSTKITADGDRVPAFYAPMIANKNWRMYCDYVCPAIVGLIFGGIHALAWFASFPTTFEKWAWRGATITIATFFGLRVCSLLLKLFKDASEKRICGLHFGGLPEFLGRLLNACFLVFIWTVFVPARIALLVLPFTSLRALPAGAFRDIDWVSIIPHI